jgi:hypothetical protein
MATEQAPPNTPTPSPDQTLSDSDKEKGKENTYMKNSLDMLEMFQNGGEDDDKKDDKQSQSNSNSKQDKDPSQNASSESPVPMEQSAPTLTQPTDALSSAGGPGSQFDMAAGGNNAGLSPGSLGQIAAENPEIAEVAVLAL